MRTQLKDDHSFAAAAFPARGAIELEKRLLELAAKEAATTAQLRTLALPSDIKISFSDFVFLTVSENLSISRPRFNVSKKGLYESGSGRRFLAQYSQEVRQLILESELYDPTIWDYTSQKSAAIMCYFVNGAKLDGGKRHPLGTTAVELNSGEAICEIARDLASRCTVQDRALEALRLHKGKVCFSVNGIALLSDEAPQQRNCDLSLDFNTATKRELKAFLKEWQRYNSRPTPNAEFSDGSPFTKAVLSKSSFFCRMLENALYEKFSILPDTRLNEIELQARSMEDRHGVAVYTKALSTNGADDRYPAFSLSDLQTVDRFLTKASVLRTFYDRVIKVDGKEPFNGAENEMREIMQMRFYDFTFRRLNSGTISNGESLNRIFGVLTDSSKYGEREQIDYRSGARPLAFTPVSLAALNSKNRDYFDVVFLELTQDARVQLQLDRKQFMSCWIDSIEKITADISQQLKISKTKTLGAVVSILIGRVLLDVQRAISRNAPIKLTDAQRDWVLANLEIAIDADGLPTRTLPTRAAE